MARDVMAFIPEYVNESFLENVLQQVENRVGRYPTNPPLLPEQGRLASDIFGGRSLGLVFKVDIELLHNSTIKELDSDS